MAKYYYIIITPKVRPKSEIYTPKRDNELSIPPPFHGIKTVQNNSYV